MLKDLNKEQTELMTTMSDISERCFSAGWMQNLEFSLWSSVLNGPRRYSMGMISQSDIDNLIDQSTVCNCWIIMDETNGETAIDLIVWQKKFDQDTNQSPNLLGY